MDEAPPYDPVSEQLSGEEENALVQAERDAENARREAERRLHQRRIEREWAWVDTAGKCWKAFVFCATVLVPVDPQWRFFPTFLRPGRETDPWQTLIVYAIIYGVGAAAISGGDFGSVAPPSRAHRPPFLKARRGCLSLTFVGWLLVVVLSVVTTPVSRWERTRTEFRARIFGTD